MLLKPAVPDVEPETAASPPRINGVRRPPKQAQPNASLSVMQQQMTDFTNVAPVYPGDSSQAVGKIQTNHNAAPNIKAAPVYGRFCCAQHRSGILKLYWQSCNTACARLSNSTGNCALVAAIRQHRLLHVGNITSHAGTDTPPSAACCGANCVW
jgi:hypothetical protein